MAGGDELTFVALGGIGEIGMNLGVYAFGPPGKRKLLVVDFGISFAGPELPGVDVVYADIAFLERERDKLLGIIITHAHEDHYGALGALWPRLRVPVYASPFTAGLLEAKAASDFAHHEVPVEIVRPGERLKLGPFEIEFVAVAHSIPEPMALAIRTPLGLVVHTGDWRLDDAPQLGPRTDEVRLRALGDEGILAVIGDSTNAARAGRSISEETVARELAAICAEAPGRVAFTLFASNAGRLRSVALAAQASGREVVVAGRALWRVIEVSSELGYFRGLPPFREASVLQDLPARNVALLLSGSQGESRAALAQVADGNHRDVKLAQGDAVVFSARAIPGNERAIIDITNKLVAMGVTVITDHDRPIHTSGHPRREELTALYDWLKPQIVVPAHGEALHLAAHAQLARDLGVPMVMHAPNGTVARLSPEPMTYPNAVATGRLYLDGTVIGPEDEIGVAERRRMAFAGHVAVAIVLDGRGEVLEQPKAALTGLPKSGSDGKAMVRVVDGAVHSALTSIPRPRRRDADLVTDAVRRSVRAAVEEVWGKKPVCTVLVTVV